MSRLMVSHIVGGGDRGGAKTHILTLLSHLDPARFRVNLICLNDGALAEEARQRGIEVRIFPMSSNLDLLVVFRLSRYLKQIKPDIVHTHGVRANLCGRTAARLAGQKRIVTTIHSQVSMDYPTPLGNRFFSMVDRMSSPMADHLICVSNQLKEFMIKRGISANRITVIRNGIDVGPYQGLSEADGIKARREWGIRPEQKVIGVVGRLVPIKGYDVFLEAAQKVAAFEPDSAFMLIGEGPSEDELKLKAQELGIDDRVWFTGHRNDIPVLFRMMDVFVISSFSEGGPIVLLEAMASGIPVVATRVGGIPEILSDQVNGLQVEPKKPLDLADKIIHLLKDPTLAERLRQAGYETLYGEFTLEKVTERTQELYLRMMAGTIDNSKLNETE